MKIPATPSSSNDITSIIGRTVWGRAEIRKKNTYDSRASSEATFPRQIPLPRPTHIQLYKQIVSSDDYHVAMNLASWEILSVSQGWVSVWKKKKRLGRSLFLHGLRKLKGSMTRFQENRLLWNQETTLRRHQCWSLYIWAGYLNSCLFQRFRKLYLQPCRIHHRCRSISVSSTQPKKKRDSTLRVFRANVVRNQTARVMPLEKCTYSLRGSIPLPWWWGRGRLPKGRLWYEERWPFEEPVLNGGGGRWPGPAAEELLPPPYRR